jgi:hypothetical protein
MDTQGVSSQLRTILPLLRDHPIWRQSLGQAARERVLSTYTLKGNLDLIEEMYGSIVRPKAVSRVG